VSDTTYGSTSYLPKSKITGNKLYIRVDWTRPVEEQMSVIGDSYELYRKKLNQVIVGKTSAAKGNGKVSGALGFMNMSKAQLDANYTTTFIGEEEISGGVRTWHIELMPKTEQSYKSADLWVDGDGMPRQARVVEMNNDTTTVLLANIQKNIKLNGQIFKLDYPGNVKKIKA
jgi:outer membrane lipoprotein-sorting protein